MDRDTALPPKLASINAYLGARPIAQALDQGADIVITGRCVDSAIALGPLMHEFGWEDDDYDLLSAGTLAGHIIECGCQATGGAFTDWRDVEGWDDPGFPIAECAADGTIVVTKPEGTGGLVSTGTVAEQMIYEIGDPGAYLMPDVCCDWTSVTLALEGPHRVRVSGARGRAPGPAYKVSATYQDGFRATTSLTLAGGDAAEKARRVATAILAKCRAMLEAQGIADFSESSVEIIGTETMYGASAQQRGRTRGHAQDRRAPCRQARDRSLLARGGTRHHGHCARHHGILRGTSCGGAGDQALLVPRRQGACPGQRGSRWRTNARHGRGGWKP